VSVGTATATMTVALDAPGTRLAGQPEKPAAEQTSTIGSTGTPRTVVPAASGAGRSTRPFISQICGAATPPSLRKVC
jgi:hypothetical protein